MTSVACISANGPARTVAIGASVALLTGCVAGGPETRRDSYLDCAREQGLTVRDGTIITRSAEDLARLDVCQAVPR